MTNLSVLDLALVTEGGTPRDALQRSLELAQHAEKWGYRRFWMAEHHNHDVFACSATSVVIGYIAAGTSTIRVGSGGIMLPNHAPLVIAEQFGTLEALYPGRIDLGLGRAPGGEAIEQALRRVGGRDTFPEDVVELQTLLGPAMPDQKVRATPGTGSRVPQWILGSSLNGAQLAARLGLPFAFAAHFRPDNLMPALAAYREGFTPSPYLQKPYAMVATNVIAADSDEEAQWLYSSLQQFAIIPVRQHVAGFIAPPRAKFDADWSPAEQQQVAGMLMRAIVGGRETVRRGLENLIAGTGVDEVMALSVIYDQSARLRSYQILSEVADAK